MLFRDINHAFSDCAQYVTLAAELSIIKIDVQRKMGIGVGHFFAPLYLSALNWLREKNQ